MVFILDQGIMARDLGKRMSPYNDLNSISNTSRSVATEYEEMVLGDIKNINKYIKQIIVFVNPNYKDIVDTEMYPSLFSNPKTKLVVGTKIKDTPDRYDRFQSRKEFDKTSNPLTPDSFTKTLS